MLSPEPTADTAPLTTKRGGESLPLVNGHANGDGEEVFQSRCQSSAELHSAASRICNPPASLAANDVAKHDALSNVIRRYGRLQICATPVCAPEEFAPETTLANLIAKQDAADMLGLCRGDDDAMTRSIHRHAPKLRRAIAKMLRDEDEASEVVAETFIRVYRNRERFDIGAKFTAWLYTIALNQARNRLRRRARQPEFVPLEELSEEELESQPFVTDSPSPDVCLENCEIVHEMEVSLATLPPQLREPLKLFACEDCSQAELAEQFNCSVKAIESRLYNGRKRLRAKFDRFLHPPDTWLFIDPFKPQHEIKTKI